MADSEKAALMRSVNEGIALFADGLEPSDSDTPDRWSFVCECGAPDCVEWVDLEQPQRCVEIYTAVALEFCA